MKLYNAVAYHPFLTGQAVGSFISHGLPRTCATPWWSFHVQDRPENSINTFLEKKKKKRRINFEYFLQGQADAESVLT